MPVRLTLIPLLDWVPPLEPWLLEPPPKLRLAWLAPTVMVMSSMPSLKPKLPRLIVGPWRLSGPSEIVFGVVAPPAAESLT